MSTTASDIPTTRRRLTLEWSIALGSAPAGPDAWRSDECLKHHSPADLPTTYNTLSVTERNTVLAALLRLARTELFCELAVFVLMHQRIAWRVSSARILQGTDNFTRDAIVLTAMHSAIQYRSPGSENKIFSSLALNTLHELNRLSRSERAAMDEIPSDDQALAALASGAQTNAPSPSEELVELLAWAADTQALTSYHVGLLARLHLGGRTLQAVADEDGVSIRTIANHTTRARQDLKLAVQNHIQAWGRWS
ncbi:DNA-directed RNA polymerase specialized sigma24 family protein [Arthrobacter sp. GAS37]|uniref:hypothetical protein n=1 Tax=Arthrobacter sp. GAS37 TaxID=3156261 RepID=UPI003832ADB9